MNQFGTLQEVVELQKAGRTNAAKSKWQSLPDVFKSGVIELIMLLMNQVPSFECASFDSANGKFSIWNDVVGKPRPLNSLSRSEIIQVLPEVVL